ncbi:unnamed protein product [Zymoseptoria tritici ST99CH_1E4]|uniref:Uncharacterized protein n=1 Tax=Zymoseptoria tritici ST99CH_1E4 TaxID=1276532 RepID=A0A2H1FZP5_ZYMTR|nr:unnamed protein product [Zymoseptoria tritici ST99CH_1E4]
MSLSAQWDVGNSLSGAASGMRALALVLSKEEVQPQAGFAFDAIGARLNVDDALHGDAVVALNGDESVRLAGIKLLIGLQSGGVAQALRSSSSCVRTFLLVAALKGCSYEEQEIADILYEMMRSTNLLSQVPIAPRQLRRMVKAVSGNAEGMLEQTTWEKIPEKDMGKLLMNAFNATESGVFDCTEVSGNTGLIRIASIMLWLSPEQTGLFAGEDCIFGSKTGQLRIKYAANTSPLDHAGVSAWTVKNWRALKSSISIITDDPDDEEFIAPHPYTNMIPLGVTRQYYANLAISARGTDLLGGFAAALLDSISDFGRAIPYDTNRFIQEPKRWAEAILYDNVPLRKLWPSSFLHNLKQPGGLWESLGWTPSEIEQSRLPVYQDLTTYIESERAITAERLLQRLSYRDVDDHSENTEKTAPIYSGTAVREVFKDAVSKHWPSPSTVEKVLFHIETLVASALLLSQQRPIGTITPFFNPATPGDWIWDAMGRVGCMLPKLAELCLKASVNPCNAAFKIKGNRSPLMVASHGRVAFPYILRDHSCLQEDALAVSVIAGNMRYNDRAHEVVLETSPTEDAPGSLQKQRPPSAMTAQAGPGASSDDSTATFKLPANTNESKLTHLIAETETSLLLKTRLSSEPHPDRAQFTQVVSYKDTALRIAAAEHMDDESWHGIHNMDRRISPDFLQQIRLVECESLARDQVQASGVDRVVTKMPHDQAQRFFAADPVFCGMPWEIKLRVQQFMPIDDCVKIMVEDEGMGSKLITRGIF